MKKLMEILKIHENGRHLIEDKEELATAILSLMKGIVPEEKEEFETCTGCGGIGSVPNHPHIEAHTCKRCNGSGIISRDDFKMWNACRKEMLRRIDE